MPAPDLDSRQRFLSLSAVIAGAFGAGLGLGALIPLLALRLEAQGIASWLIGLNGAMVPLAVLAFGPLVPRVIGRFGTLPSLLASFALFNGCVLLFPVLESFGFWLVLRLLSGMAVAVHWVVTETWMNMMATDRNRGRVMGLYVTVMSMGFAAGPAAISLTGVGNDAAFLLVFAAGCLSILPMLLARSVIPAMPAHASGRLLRSLTVAPYLMVAALLGGVMDLAVMNLLPLYGTESGFDEGTAALMLTIFAAGNVALQIPIGWLADRWGKTVVMLLCNGGALAGALLLPLPTSAGLGLWILLFLWGGLLFAIYTVALGMLGDRFPPAHLAAANTVFVMVYNVGSVTGPIIGGGAMDLWPRGGLPMTIAIAAVILIAVTLWRRTGNQRRATGPARR